MPHLAGLYHKQFWIVSGKAALVLLLGYTLYHQIGGHDYWKVFLEMWAQDLWSQHWPYLICALLLMPINWVLETWKWWTLFNKIYPSPFLLALKAVLAGITLSLFTPHRVGEYGGRLLPYPVSAHRQVIMASLVANYGQLLSLISAGFLGISYVGRIFFAENDILYYSGLGLFGLFITVLWWSFLAIKRFIPIISKLNWPKWMQWLPRTFELGAPFNKAALMQVAFLASLRYLIYSWQLVLLLYFFGLNIPWLSLLMGVFAIFLLQSGLPLPPALGVLTRGELGVLVWQHFQPNPLVILAASLALFIINLAIPALLGMIVIVKTNITKSFDNERGAD